MKLLTVLGIFFLTITTCAMQHSPEKGRASQVSDPDIQKSPQIRKIKKGESFDEMTLCQILQRASLKKPETRRKSVNVE